MNFNLPRNSKYQWTRHSLFKMRQYGLSPQRIIRVIRCPERVEIGIAKNTVAVMQPASAKHKNFRKIWSQEIWAMCQIFTRDKKTHDLKFKTPKCGSGFNNKLEKSKVNKAKVLKIISVWRYPGVSPKSNPIPEEILREIREFI